MPSIPISHTKAVVGRFVMLLLAVAGVLLGATYFIDLPIYRYFCFGMSLSSLLVAISVFTTVKFYPLRQLGASA
ncbi:MAG: hypothetical protein ACR2RL_00450 [Gammaproteobacteria bacterium]